MKKALIILAAVTVFTSSAFAPANEPKPVKLKVEGSVNDWNKQLGKLSST